MTALCARRELVALDALLSGYIDVASVAKGVHLSDVRHWVGVVERLVLGLKGSDIAVWGASDAEVSKSDDVVSCHRPERRWHAGGDEGSAYAVLSNTVSTLSTSVSRGIIWWGRLDGDTLVSKVRARAAIK